MKSFDDVRLYRFENAFEVCPFCWAINVAENVGQFRQEFFMNVILVETVKIVDLIQDYIEQRITFSQNFC